MIKDLNKSNSEKFAAIRQYISAYPYKGAKELMIPNFINDIKQYKLLKDTNPNAAKRILDTKIAPLVFGWYLYAWKRNHNASSNYNKISYGYDIDDILGELYLQVKLSCSTYKTSNEFQTNPRYYFVRALVSRCQTIYNRDKRAETRNSDSEVLNDVLYDPYLKRYDENDECE